MQTIVPFDGETPKTRLADVLELSERKQFARAMLQDVLRVIRAVGSTPLVLSRTPLDLTDEIVRVDDRELSAAVNTQLQRGPSETAVVMADLPLLTPATLNRLLKQDSDVVLAYGMGGGTNALVSRHPDFTVDYHDGSYSDHLATARDIGASVTEVDSYRLSMDIDEPADLAELLLYGEGNAAEWLREHGFELSEGSGRSQIQRSMAPASRQ